jgi:hypothetical protein
MSTFGRVDSVVACAGTELWISFQESYLTFSAGITENYSAFE